MARREVIVMTDDLDGSQADETVTFSLGNTSYELDLSRDNAQRLRSLLEPYMKAGRKTLGRSGRRRTSSQSTGDVSPGEVRAWAASQGITVSERGRIPADLREQFDAAHA